MADVKIIDIDSEQWNMKDQNARDRLTALEDFVKTKDLNNLSLYTKSGYSSGILELKQHYSFGKIHFAQIRVDNISGANIGTSGTATCLQSNMKPIKTTTFIMYDFRSAKVLRCEVNVNGDISIGESVGVTSGSNSCSGEVIWAEE